MKQTLEIHFHTNYTCNLSCKHCYNESGFGKADIMPVEKGIQFIEQLCGAYEAEIHLEGGEIFLYPEFLCEMDRLSQDILGRITITTNGTICIKDEKIMRVLSRIEALRISVEGSTDNQQMSLRGIGLKRVLETASFYQHNNIPVWLRVTLNKFNYRNFVGVTLIELQKRGFSNIQIYEFQKVGRGNKYSNLYCLDNSIDELLKDLAKYQKQITGQVKFMFAKRRIPEILRHKELLEDNHWSVNILPPERGISVHPDGNVFLCAWDNDCNHAIANILNIPEDNLLVQLNNINLVHECNYCSAIRIAKDL